MRQARHLMEKGDYVAAKRKLVRVLELDQNHAEAKALLAQCEQKIEAQRTAELEELNNAVEAGTEQALRDFIERYPEGFYIEQAQNYLQDFHLWDTARQKGTKDAYLEYLSTSTIQGYKNEAELAIKTIDAAAAWAICKKNLSINKLEEFIEDYADTPYEKEARYELYLMKAENYYDLGAHSSALKCYEDANKIHSLTGQYSKHYRELQTEARYNEIKWSNRIADLKDFLSRTSTDSPYYDPISNRLALALSDKFTVYSSEADFNEAKKYARDTATKAKVQEAIDNIKVRKRDLRIAERKKARQNKGKGLVSFDLNVLSCYYGNAFEVETGMRVRLGRADQRLNFLIGTDVQLYMYTRTDYEYGYGYLYSGTTFFTKLTIPASVRLNFGKGFSRWYIGLGTVLYPNLASTLRPCFAIEPQFGLSGNKWSLAVHFRHVTNKYGITESSSIDNMLGLGLFYSF
jgi:hypothetical protein